MSMLCNKANIMDVLNISIKIKSLEEELAKTSNPFHRMRLSHNISLLKLELLKLQKSNQ
jgi:hypothetical protein